MFKRFIKNDKKENGMIEENTRNFIAGFRKLVEQDNQVTINRLIKFMANSVQGELVAKCFYNDRSYTYYPRHIFYAYCWICPMKNFINVISNVRWRKHQ